MNGVLTLNAPPSAALLTHPLPLAGPCRHLDHLRCRHAFLAWFYCGEILIILSRHLEGDTPDFPIHIATVPKGGYIRYTLRTDQWAGFWANRVDSPDTVITGSCWILVWVC